MMRKFLLPLFSVIACTNIHGQTWPVLKHYDQQHLSRIALPLGGIGTGTVSVSGRGELRDWEIMNRPAKNYSGGKYGNGVPFFSIFVKQHNGKTFTKGLMGQVENNEYQAKEGRPTDNHGIPRFSNSSFDAAYPFGQVHLSDSNMPVKVTLKAFNPLVPADADASGIPIAVLKYEVTNITNEPLEVSVCGLMRNFIGMDGSKTKQDWTGDNIPVGANKNINVFKKGNGIQGIYMYSDSVDKNLESWGTMALTTTATEGVTYRRSSVSNEWENALLNFWDDFSADGKLTDKGKLVEDNPQASLAVSVNIPAGQTKTVTFFITWDFPNRYGWSSKIVGNYYATQYTDAWDVAQKTAGTIDGLEKKTLQFVNTFVKTTLPDVVKEAALFNVSTLRSQTVFRINDGTMMGWEGCFDDRGSCHGSCTHVWNYEQATPFLFGKLSQTMRKAEYLYGTNDSGKMCFRIGLPMETNGTESGKAAADGQMGTIMRMYRDWQLSGDNAFLEQIYPSLKKTMEFCWYPGGWDGNKDGIMEGIQHNTMDVEYYGPNPQMQLWYLGALKAMIPMATTMKDNEMAATCQKLFENGSRFADEKMFNGEYYEQIIQVPTSKESVLSGTYLGGVYLKDPPYQLGRGCLVDQLVGQYMAHICGLGYLVKPGNIKKTLESIMKYNYQPSMANHFNNMRSYALGNEAALLMASFPKGRPEIPFPYFNEVMTGFEYTAATGMLYEGMEKEGLLCIKNIRDRNDGAKRNPFDEPECGHHYARAMASWSAVLAMSGFNYSGVNQSINFTSTNGTYFWSNGFAWGNVIIDGNDKVKTIKLNVLKGDIFFNTISLNGFGVYKLTEAAMLKEGDGKEWKIKQQ